MSTEFSRLRQEPRNEQRQFENQQGQVQAKEFASVEDLLRLDSAQNPVPLEVGEQLNNSIAAEAPPSRPWYRKIFGRA